MKKTILMAHFAAAAQLALAMTGAQAQPQSIGPGAPPVMMHQSDQAKEAEYVASLFFKYDVLGPRGVPLLAPGAPSPFTAVDDGRDDNGKPRWLDGPKGQGSLARLIGKIISQEQFADLDRLLADWNGPASRTADGRPILIAFRRVFENMLGQISDLEKLGAVVAEWKAQNPKSVSVALLEGIYWKTFAWEARGQGYSPSVSNTGWQLFQSRMEKAEAVLLASRPYASASPVWYETYIGVAATLGKSKAELIALANEGAARHKNYFAIFSITAHFLTPKWGGSWELLDTFIKASAKMAQDTEGHSNYTRLYWHVAQYESIGFDVFKNSLADWPQMRKGFHDVLERYPHSVWNLNSFAAFACRAGDGAVFNALAAQLNGKIIREAWPSNYSHSVCKAKFAKGTL